MSKVSFKVIKDAQDGVLYIAEGKQIPFDIKRVYFIDQVNRLSLRGCHAHKKLKQAIFCLRGSCEVEAYDGKELSIFKLKEKKAGFYIPPLLWHSMRKFSKDCLLVVFASDVFKESDYIRDLKRFKSCL